MDLTQFVPQYYQMDPMNEALLATGRMLKDGMVVLIADPALRWNPHKIVGDITQFDDLLYHAGVMNRWCVVQDIEIVGNEIFFTGNYDDGIQIRRHYPLTESWLLKIQDLSEDDYLDFVPADIKSVKTKAVLEDFDIDLSMKQKDEGRYLTPDPIPEVLGPIKPYTWNEEPERFENPNPNILHSRFNRPNQTVKLYPEQVNPHLHYPAAFTDFDPDKD